MEILLPSLSRHRAFDLRPALLLSSAIPDSDGSVLRDYTGLFQQGGGGDPVLRKRSIELYDELQAPLHGYLSCLGLQPQEAEDIIQETFLRLFRGLSKGMRQENLRGWVFRVAHNLTLNAHKRSAKALSSDNEQVNRLLESRIDPSLNPEEAVLKKEQLSRIISAVSHLTLQQRQCLHLRAEGLRYREIAAVLGVSTQRVADIVQTALVRISSEV